MDLEFKPRPESAVTRLVAWTSETALKGRSDPSTWSLVGANAFAAATALVGGMSARELVLVYSAQSVFISLCGALRITLMRERGMRDFDDEAPRGSEPLAARLRACVTYLAFWTVPQAVLVASILWSAQTKQFQPIPVDWLGFALCLAVFAAHHVYSLVHNLRADAAGSGSDRGLMFVIPFFRLFPMGIISVVAVQVGADANTFALAFTALMKSVADLISHQFEHQLLQTRRDDKPYVS